MAQRINDLEEENKKNSNFFAQQLIQKQDATKDLCITVENTPIEQKPTTETKKIAAAAKTLMELMMFTNGRNGVPNPNANRKQHLWRRKKPYIPNNLPNGELSQRCHLDNNKSYCHSCGFDSPPGHTIKTWSYKKKNDKDEVTIVNRMGGTTTKCFHHQNSATLKNKN